MHPIPIHFKVLVTGPESSGKSTLARQLAWALDGVFVPEYAREYLNRTDGVYAQDDLLNIFREQRAAEQQAQKTQSGALIVCDTGPFVIHVWSEVKYGSIHPEIVVATQSADYDLIFLCYPDLPWEDDPLREAPDEAARLELFHKYEKLLRSNHQSFVVIEGDKRVETVVKLLLGFSEFIPKNLLHPE